MATHNLVNRQRGEFMFMVLVLLLLPGCLATQSWVDQRLQTMNTRMTDMEQQISNSGSRFAAADPRLANQVSDQIQPLENRVAGIEQKFSAVENRLTRTEENVNKINTTTGRSIEELKNLQLTRRLVLDLRQGANFKANSSKLLARAKKHIDTFLDSLDRKPANDHLFFVAGYTDNTGSSELNYVLGRKRAESVGRYLVVDKLIHPARVITASGGDRNPAASNTTPQGRELNRRVEILVYRNVITKVSPGISATLSRMALTPEVAQREK